MNMYDGLSLKVRKDANASGIQRSVYYRDNKCLAAYIFLAVTNRQVQIFFEGIR